MKRPSPELVNLYLLYFETNGYSRTEKAIDKLVAAFPHNNDPAEVLVKAAAINNLYNTNIYDIYTVAEHIWNLQIDDSLQQQSAELIEAIANVNIRGKNRRNYSFATKYCHFHRPDTYPIYDSVVEQALWAYQIQDRFASFKRRELQQYLSYQQIMTQFQHHYCLTTFNLRELDHFLWLIGRESI